MPAFDPIVWLLIACCAVSAVLMALYAQVKAAERERTIIDLRRRVTSLRVEYAEKLAEIAERERVNSAVLIEQSTFKKAA